MLNSFPFAVFTGTVLGILAGLGVGGGSLLILWLSLVLNMSQQTCRGINLLFFIPAAVISCILQYKKGKLSPEKLLPAILAGTAAAAVFSFAGSRIDTEALKKPFGFLLLFTGLREILYRERKPK